MGAQFWNFVKRARPPVTAIIITKKGWLNKCIQIIESANKDKALETK